MMKSLSFALLLAMSASVYGGTFQDTPIPAVPDQPVAPDAANNGDLIIPVQLQKPVQKPAQKAVQKAVQKPVQKAVQKAEFVAKACSSRACGRRGIFSRMRDRRAARRSYRSYNSKGCSSGSCASMGVPATMQFAFVAQTSCST